MADPRVELRLTARDQTQAAFQAVRRGLGSLNTTVGVLRGAVLKLGPAFAAIGVGLSVAGLTRFVKSGIDAADQLGVVSKRTGVTVEQLSLLKFAAEQSETSFETLAAGLVKFELNLAKAGISGTQTIAVMKALADRVQATEDPALRLDLAFKAFGRGIGKELVPYLALGGAGLEQLFAKARELGLELSGPAAKAADDFNDKLQSLGAQISQVAVVLGGGLIKGFGDLSDLRLDAALRQQIEDIGRALGEVARNATDAIGAIVSFGDSVARAIANASRFLNTSVTELGNYQKVTGDFEGIGIATKGIETDAVRLKDRIGELQEKVKGYRVEVEKAGAGGIIDDTGLKVIADTEIAIGRLEGQVKKLGGDTATATPGYRR